MPNSIKSARDYQRYLPAEDQRELSNCFSENILFAAEALTGGFRIRGLETFTAVLQEPARALFASLQSVRFVLRRR
jgi:hypothetical protein